VHVARVSILATERPGYYLVRGHVPLDVRRLELLESGEDIARLQQSGERNMLLASSADMLLTWP
jgi:hypothetical protein